MGLIRGTSMKARLRHLTVGGHLEKSHDSENMKHEDLFLILIDSLNKNFPAECESNFNLFLHLFLLKHMHVSSSRNLVKPK